MERFIFVLTIYLFLLININGNLISNQETTDYPPYWHIAPSSLSEYPLVNTSNSSYRLINPWYYPHRLGLFKILINITTPYMPFCELSNGSNILFGLPSQFGWLFRSNRLFTNNTMNISTDSWWASANYYLSVIPFLAAYDLGLISNESIRIIPYENFCSNSIDCLHQIPNAMAQWHLYFLRLQRAPSCLENKNFDQRMIDKCYLEDIWLAYKSSIYHSLPLIQTKLQKLPSNTEKFFGLAWARLINLISMTRKNTNLYETLKNQRKFLPFRMLKQSDKKFKANDLSDSVKKSLKILFTFRFDQIELIEKFWYRITCNYQSRIYAQSVLETMALSKMVATYNLMKATVTAYLYPCDR